MTDYKHTLAFQVLQRFEGYKAEIEKYACIGQYCPIPCYITAHDGNTFLYVNPAFIEATGLTINDMTEVSWHRMYPPEDYDSIISNWSAFVKTRQPFRVKQRWVNVKTGAVVEGYNYVHAVEGNGFVGFLMPLNGNPLIDGWYPQQEAETLSTSAVVQ